MIFSNLETNSTDVPGSALCAVARCTLWSPVTGPSHLCAGLYDVRHPPPCGILGDLEYNQTLHACALLRVLSKDFELDKVR